MAQLLERGTLVPQAFPIAVGRTVGAPAVSPVRPFGLSRAVPVVPELEGLPALSLCPERQINVTPDGEPFVHAPSMKTAFTTQSQTREDSQLATDTENDTD
ncbi:MULTISPECIES: putative ATP-grasp-modified RiPP [unclassified Streptomyces]|uniref:putative ATP-grasp-modified RiPP n=1 Tax=unclassified Streptomyces TaxID=2593676 RepID=UPI002E2AEA3F|nr:putative ATP-grasp-modified RiPP [Streptomyces sp. NBC_00223]